MKTKLFNDYTHKIENHLNMWLDENKNLKIEDIKFSSCCSQSGTVYVQVMVLYSDEFNTL